MITGLGCISGAGRNLLQTMACLHSGKRNPQPPQRFSYQLDKDYPIFEVTGFESRATDLSACFAEFAVAEALEQAGLDSCQLSQARVGVFLGSTAGCFFNKEQVYRDSRRNPIDDRVAIANTLLNGSIAHQIAKTFNFSGPAMTLSNACASGTDAIGLAAGMIARGECDIAVAGGCDEIVRMVYLGFISLMNTSDEPCLPFSKNRKGLNLGEGSGICILESSDSVRRRGIQPLAYVCGYACVSDAYHVTAPEPSGRGLQKAFTRALTVAGIEPSEVAFINVHGTGTLENDRVEGRVVSELFGKEAVVSATKAYTGHALGAAGGLEAVFATQCLIERKVPGIPEDAVYEPDCGIRLHHGIKTISGRYACSASLAFGGINSVLVIGGIS